MSEVINGAAAFNGRALKVYAWPEEDRQRWQDACTPNNDLLSEAIAADWRASSRELFERCYGVWLAWLTLQGFLHPDQQPGDRVSPERIVAYLKARRALGNGARTLVNDAVGLRHMFEALDPNRDWSWMLPMICKLKTKVEHRTNHFDLPSILELFALGLALMDRYNDAASGPLKARAIGYRNGLAIAILAARPFMRRNNISTIRLGSNLSKEGEVFRLKFSRDEMKGKRTMEAKLPKCLTEPIEIYLARFRPILLGNKVDLNNALWISAQGKPVFPHAFSHEVGKVTDQAFGRRVTMHDFRRAAGSSIAKEDPAHIGIVANLLGHASFKTSERFYIFAKEYAAFERQNCVVDKGARLPPQ